MATGTGCTEAPLNPVPCSPFGYFMDASLDVFDVNGDLVTILGLVQKADLIDELSEPV